MGFDDLDVDGHSGDGDADPLRRGLLRILGLGLTGAGGCRRTGHQEGEEQGNVTGHGSHGGRDRNTQARPGDLLSPQLTVVPPVVLSGGAFNCRSSR